MTLITDCYLCKHAKANGVFRPKLESGKVSCMAFPNGIPNEIRTGKKRHHKPWPNQENDLVYEMMLTTNN